MILKPLAVITDKVSGFEDPVVKSAIRTTKSHKKDLMLIHEWPVPNVRFTVTRLCEIVECDNNVTNPLAPKRWEIKWEY